MKENKPLTITPAGQFQSEQLQQKELFSHYNSAPTNSIFTMKKSLDDPTKTKKDIITGLTTVEHENIIAKMLLKNNFSLSLGTNLLLHCLLKKLTETVSYKTKKYENVVINLNIEEYLLLTGKEINKNNKDYARKSIKKELMFLHTFLIQFYKYPKSKNKEMITLNMISGSSIKNNEIKATIPADTVLFLANSQISFFPTWLLKLDSKKPRLYYTALKLIGHLNINITKSKSKVFRIKVSKLLENNPAIPTYDQVKNTDRHFTRKIIDPLETSLDFLQEQNYILWRYTGPKGRTLNNEEISNNFDSFKELFVEYIIKDFCTDEETENFLYSDK